MSEIEHEWIEQRSRHGPMSIDMGNDTHDRECRALELMMISAKHLKDVRRIFHMKPYVVASISGDEGLNNKQHTPADSEGGTSPRWDYALPHPFIVDVAAARTGRLSLKLEIRTKRTLGDRHVGRVDVPVRELLEQGGDGEPRVTSYAVRLPRSERTGGILEFSYKFGEVFTVHEAPPDQAPPDQPPSHQQPPKAGRVWRDGLIVVGVLSNAVSDVLDM